MDEPDYRHQQYTVRLMTKYVPPYKLRATQQALTKVYPGAIAVQAGFLRNLRKGSHNLSSL